jgi:hypothetical protein
MARFDGTLARTLDFGDLEIPIPGRRQRLIRVELQVVRPARAVSAPLTGPEKYAALTHRRRQAQIKARRLLDLL